MEQLRGHVQVETSLYGMQLNLTKTKILEGPSEQESICFVDGTIVNQAEQVRFLGTQVNWASPTKCAIDSRKALANFVCM